MSTPPLPSSKSKLVESSPLDHAKVQVSKIVQALHGLLYNSDRIVENPAIADPSWKIFLFVKPSAAASLAPSLVKQHFEHDGHRTRISFARIFHSNYE